MSGTTTDELLISLQNHLIPYKIIVNELKQYPIKPFSSIATSWKSNRDIIKFICCEIFANQYFELSKLTKKLHILFVVMMCREIKLMNLVDHYAHTTDICQTTQCTKQNILSEHTIKYFLHRSILEIVKLGFQRYIIKNLWRCVHMLLMSLARMGYCYAVHFQKPACLLDNYYLLSSFS